MGEPGPSVTRTPSDGCVSRQDVRRSGRRLVSALAPLLLGCLLLLALDVAQQALQLADLFAGRPDWLRFCLAALLVLNALYVLLLCGTAWRRGRTALPGRYRALMAVTCLTAAAACVEHAERRVSLTAHCTAAPTAETGGGTTHRHQSVPPEHKITGKLRSDTPCISIDK